MPELEVWGTATEELSRFIPLLPLRTIILTEMLYSYNMKIMTTQEFQPYQSQLHMDWVHIHFSKKEFCETKSVDFI